MVLPVIPAAQQGSEQAASAAAQQAAPAPLQAAAAAQQAPAQAAAASPITGGFDLTRLHELLAVGVHKVEDVKDEDVVIVAGLIGVGKSTFINAMVKNELKKTKTQGRYVLSLADSSADAAVIGHSISAQTQYPAVYGTTIKFCDTPGINDNRTLEERACASITTEIAVHNAKSIKAVIVVFDYTKLDRGGNFQEVLESLTQLLRKPQELPLLWLFTKIENSSLNKEDIKDQIQAHLDFFNERIASQEQRITRSMISGLIFDIKKGIYSLVQAATNSGATVVPPPVGSELNELMRDINRCHAAKEVLTAMIANMDNVFLMKADPEQTVLREEVMKRLALDTTVVENEKFNFNDYDPSRRRLEQTLSGIIADVSSHTQVHQTHMEEVDRLMAEINRLTLDNTRIEKDLANIDTLNDAIVDLEKNCEDKKNELKKAEIGKSKLEGQIPVDKQASPIVYRTPLYTDASMANENEWGISQFDGKIEALKNDTSVPAFGQTPYAKTTPMNWQFQNAWWSFITMEWSTKFNQEMTYTGPIDKYRYVIDGVPDKSKGSYGEFIDLKSLQSQWTDQGGTDSSLTVNFRYSPLHNTSASVEIHVQKNHLPETRAAIKVYMGKRDALITQRDDKQKEITKLTDAISQLEDDINAITNESTRKETLRRTLTTDKSNINTTIEDYNNKINGTPAAGNTPAVLGLKAKVKAEQEWLASNQARISLVLRLIKLIRFGDSVTDMITRFEKDYIAYVKRSDLSLKNYFQLEAAQTGNINAQVELLQSNFESGNDSMACYWLEQTQNQTGITRQRRKLFPHETIICDEVKKHLDEIKANNEENPRKLTKEEAEEQYTLGLTQNRMIGKGGFGKVYAVSRKEGGTVALKQIPLLNDAGEAMTLQEIAALRMVKSPSVIGFYGYFSDEVREQAVISLVFELAWGSLADVLYNQAQPLPLSVRLQFARQIVGALVVLHTFPPNGMVHCDLKPENFLLGQDLHLKVADFGLALTKDIGNTIRTAGSEAGAGSQSDWIRGTAAYASPEACRGEALTKRSDMYSFGLIILVLATQKPVYPSSVNFFQILYKRCDQTRPEAAELMRNIPLDTPLIMRMLIEHSCKMTAADRWTSTKAQEELAKTAVPVPLVDMMELSAQVRKATPPQKQAYYPAFNA